MCCQLHGFPGARSLQPDRGPPLGRVQDWLFSNLLSAYDRGRTADGTVAKGDSVFAFSGPAAQLCQGVTRRAWLRAGGISSLGLMLPDLLRAEDADSLPKGASFGRARSCIFCFLFGAPAHQDVWDLKPAAVPEVRGPFDPIATSVAGTQVSEHIPRTAQLADQFALIRSVTHLDSTHTVAMHYMQTGVRHRRPQTNPTNLPDDTPCFGAVMNRLHPSDTVLPAAISLNAPGNEIPSGHIFPGFFAGYLGNRYDPMFVQDDPTLPDFSPLPVARSLPRERLYARERLLGQLDQIRRRLDLNPALRDAEKFQQRAISLLSAPEAAHAFDLDREKTAVRQRYGMTPFGQGCLLARRLVEAGTRLVTVNWARDYQARVADHWDSHADNFSKHKELLMPALDLGYSALLEDLQQRGLLDETLVVVSGEFGRTPRINAKAGRDHWPGCFSIQLAGAGIHGGLLYGASDSTAAWPARDPVTPEQVAATIYHLLGIPRDTRFEDLSGQPQQLINAAPVWQLFS